MFTTIFVGGAIVTGVAVAVKMMRDGEKKLEHYSRLLEREQELDRTKDVALFQQF